MPSVAFCVVGQARGFANPLVWQSIRTNAVGAFGGAADVFVVLKFSGARRAAQLLAEAAAQLRPALPFCCGSAAGAPSAKALVQHAPKNFMIGSVCLSREEGPRLAFSGCRQANSLKCLKRGRNGHTVPQL